MVFFGLRGHAMESCDFGETWEELDTGVEASLSGAVEDDGVIVFAGNSGMVLTHSDARFNGIDHSSGVDFASVIALGGGQYLLVGEEGVHRFPESGEEAKSP